MLHTNITIKERMQRMGERKKRFKYSPIKKGPLYTDTMRALAVGETGIYPGTFHVYAGMRNAKCRLMAKGFGQWEVEYINEPVKGIRVTRIA